MTELEPTIQELNPSNMEVLICGDNDIDLLKLTGEAHFSDFFEMMLGQSITYSASFHHTQLTHAPGLSWVNCQIIIHISFLCITYLPKNYTTKASYAKNKQFWGNEKYVELHGI